MILFLVCGLILLGLGVFGILRSETLGGIVSLSFVVGLVVVVGWMVNRFMGTA